MKDVPYSRLVDASPINQLPLKLDSDSILNTERSKSILNVPEIETAPKSSVSDSKLAVDYFSVPENEFFQQSTSPQALKIVTTEPSPVSTNSKGTECVNVSDSHHSLSARSDSEERLKQEVQRTVSMSSENHSEAFYSADEDISHGLGGSQTPSLRQSMIGSGPILTRNDSIKKKFSSDLSIVESSANVNLVVAEKAHTLERAKPQSLYARKSPRIPNHASFKKEAEPTENGILQDSSDSHSISSTSFISAVSSQEDMTLVNLHMQVNKPIVDSPLLMSSYVSHLTQVRTI